MFDRKAHVLEINENLYFITSMVTLSHKEIVLPLCFLKTRFGKEWYVIGTSTWCCIMPSFNIYIFIPIALDEIIFLDVLHFPMKNIKSRDLEATSMGGVTSKPIQ